MYGLLSKVLSPKRVRERAKLAMEKKMSGGAGGASQPGDGAGDREEEEEATVVKVVCHHTEELKGSSRERERHSGRVWLPQSLGTRINIDPHSSVRIKTIKSTPKVATSIHLQPLQPLPAAESEVEIQTALLGRLHTQSHKPLACLTGRSNTILLQYLQLKESHNGCCGESTRERD